MNTAHDTWLAQIQEDALDPELAIIDAHHHLWDHPDSRYVVEDYLADVKSGHNIVQSVFVECLSQYRKKGPEQMKPVGETENVRNLAETSDANADNRTRIATGIVGFANLALGDSVEAVLASHISASGARFRGVRHASGWDVNREIRNAHSNPPPCLLSNADFRKGFACLEKFNLSFDAWLYHPQIPELTELARAFPNTTIILDHIGGPLGIGPYAGKRDHIFEHWKHDIEQLAQCHNVFVKLGGFAMKVNGFEWHTQTKPPTSKQLADAAAPWYLHCIEQFGTERCMFESNFPVEKVSCSYGVLWNAFKRVADGFSESERQELFHDTAAHAYQLAPVAGSLF